MDDPTPGSNDARVMKTMQLNDQKAGMEGLDKEMINKIIYETSKGTPFFAFQEKRQKSIDCKVKELQSSLKNISDSEYKSFLLKMDMLCSSLDSERDLSRSIVHIDMDAFYAAVETEDNPKLKDKPMAVGTLAMLSTSNYIARKFGVRAAMPGFIAKKLCPNLTIVPCNFAKYRKVSQVVRGIVQEYDPDFCPASLDEMYLDLTEYIQNKREDPSQEWTYEQKDAMVFKIVQEIRERICLATNLTASAGIAPNVMLAKVGSDQNKPNGQYQIASTREAVMAFVSSLPVKKISGIGPVQGQILNALGIQTCSDLYQQRALVAALFKPTSADFYMRAAIGIASTTVKSDYVRKSIGVEQTFREIHDKVELHKKCLELCEEAVEDMKLKNMIGKVVVLKMKSTDFKSQTRNHTLPAHTADLDVFCRAAKRLLDAEIDVQAPRPLKLRLMGIRIANLVYEDEVSKGITIKTFLTSKLPDQSNYEPQKATTSSKVDDMSVTRKGVEVPNITTPILPSPSTDSTSNDNCYLCPICNTVPKARDLTEFNIHIDGCLNRNAIKELLANDIKEAKRKQEEQLNQKVKKAKLVHTSTDRPITDYFVK